MHNWGYYYPNNYNYWPNLGIGIVAFLLHLFFWFLVIWLIFALIKHMGGNNSHGEADSEEESDADNKNITIIKERYAKGEITKREFEQLKKDLA